MTKKPKLTVIEGGAAPASSSVHGSKEFRESLRLHGLPEDLAEIKIYTGDELPQSEASKMADEMLKGLEALAAQYGIKRPY